MPCQDSQEVVSEGAEPCERRVVPLAHLRGAVVVALAGN